MTRSEICQRVLENITSGGSIAVAVDGVTQEQFAEIGVELYAVIKDAIIDFLLTETGRAKEVHPEVAFILGLKRLLQKTTSETRTVPNTLHLSKEDSVMMRRAAKGRVSESQLDPKSTVPLTFYGINVVLDQEKTEFIKKTPYQPSAS